MTWKTHVVGGLQAGLLLSGILGEDAASTAVIVSCTALGSVLPDIDHAGSKLSRSDGLIGLISGFLSKITKHRGFTHTIPGALVIAASFYVVAVFKTERESMIAFFAALAVFLALHVTGDAVRWLAGWIASGIYLFGPQVISLITEQGIDFGLNTHSAVLCFVGIFTGCIMHDIYDSFNKGGIPWFWPVSNKNIRLMSIKTNTAGEGLFAAVQTLILIVISAGFFRDVLLRETGVDLINELVSLI